MPEVITNNLDLWSSALLTKSTAGRGSNGKLEAYGIKKLRELILELAVRGKLVPQDPNDEPASILLERIQAEKARLIAEGKIKKDKPLAAITEDEKPFELPQSWEWIFLSDLMPEFQNGVSSRGDKDGKPATVLRLADIKNRRISLDDTRIIPINSRDIEKYQLSMGDILITRVNGSADIVGSFILNDSRVEAIYCDHFIRMRIAAQWINANYLCMLGESSLVRNKIQSLFITTAGQKTVNQGHIGSLPIALPPFAEQHRIVAKVDELMALCDQMEQQQTHSIEAHQTLVASLLGTLTRVESQQEFSAAWARIASHFDTLFTTEVSIDQLKQTILQLAVMGKLVPQDPNDEPASALLKGIAKEKERLIKEGKIRKQKALPEISDVEMDFNLPVGWAVSRLGTFTNVGTGATPSRDKAAYWSPQEVNWVASGETCNDFITETSEKISSIAVKETNVTVYPVGTLIVAMYGQGKTRGQVSELMIEAGTNQACAVVVLINKDEAHRRYLKLFFKKAYEEMRSHSAGGAQPNLNVGKISDTVVPLPPLFEQKRIVNKVEELMSLCDAIKACLVDAQTIQLHLADTIVEQAVC